MKITYILPLLLFPLICSAEDYALTKANNDFNRSLVKFNEADDACRASATVLPKNTFSDLKISEENAKTALLYYYFKSLSECTDEAIKEYLLSSSLLAALADKERAQNIYESSELIIDAKLHLLKAEAKYAQMDEALRESLDKIEQLKKPFKLIESADHIGLK